MKQYILLLCMLASIPLFAAEPLPDMHQVLAKLHTLPPLPHNNPQKEDIQTMYNRACREYDAPGLLTLLQKSDIQPQPSKVYLWFTNWKSLGHVPTKSQVGEERTKTQLFSMLLAYNYPAYAPGNVSYASNPWGLPTPEGTTYDDSIIHQALHCVALHPYKPTREQEESFIQLVEQTRHYHHQGSPHMRQLLIPATRYLMHAEFGINEREHCNNSNADDKPNAFETTLKTNSQNTKVAKSFLERGANPTSRGDASGGYTTLSADESIMNAFKSYWPGNPKQLVPLSDDALTALAYLLAYHKDGLSTSWERLTPEQQKTIQTRALNVLVTCPHHWTVHQQQSGENLMRILPGVINEDTDPFKEAITSDNYDRAVFLLQNTQTKPTQDRVTACITTLLNKIRTVEQEQQSTNAHIAMLAILTKHYPESLPHNLTEQEQQLFEQFRKQYIPEGYV